jgi:hypothetical protein
VCGLTQVLVFIESVIVKKKGGICELMDSHHITSRGTIFGRRGCGEFVYHVSYCDERVVMTIYGFQIFCDVSSGV